MRWWEILYVGVSAAAVAALVVLRLRVLWLRQRRARDSGGQRSKVVRATAGSTVRRMARVQVRREPERIIWNGDLVERDSLDAAFDWDFRRPPSVR